VFVWYGFVPHVKSRVKGKLKKRVAAETNKILNTSQEASGGLSEAYEPHLRAMQSFLTSRYGTMIWYNTVPYTIIEYLVHT
jgi:hypothetical protein